MGRWENNDGGKTQGSGPRPDFHSQREPAKEGESRYIHVGAALGKRGMVGAASDWRRRRAG